MYEHKKLQSELEKCLQAFSIANRKEWNITTEKHIVPPVTSGFRRIDVAVETNQEGQRGYAFEIKTTNSTGDFVLHQLRDSLIAGFRPILIGPSSFFDQTLPRSPDIPVSWVVKALSASFITPTGSGMIDFQLVEDRLPVDDELRPFFQ